MSQIIITDYKDEDMRDELSIIVSSFYSKFNHRQSLSMKAVEDTLYSIWDIKASDPSYIHYVAKEDDKIVGAILIRCFHASSHEKPLDSSKLGDAKDFLFGTNQNSKKKIPLGALCRKNGFYNTFMLFFKLTGLEINMHNDCYIEHIAVASNQRGKGIGEMLLAHSEKALIKRGYPSLALAVADGNPAKHLYDRFGFRDIRILKSPLKSFILGIGKWTVMRKQLDKEGSIAQ